MAQFPLSPLPLAGSPLLPFVSPSTYLAPSSCDRNRLLPLRLLVNWPHLPHPSPNCPTLSKFPDPNCPAPNNDDLGNIPALAIRNSNCKMAIGNLHRWAP